jgi:HEAT repeat protein
MRRISVVFAVALGLVAANAGAQGAKPKGKPAAVPVAPPFTLTPVLQQKLKSGDEAQVRAALDELRLVGKGAQAVAPAVAELLERGTSAPLTEAALDTLGDMEAETTSEQIAVYTHHRDVALRRAAVKALIKTKGPAAAKGLRHALADADPMVRGVAATGLGSLKAKDALPDLYVALEHKIGEAAAAIGQLCTGADCDPLSAKLGRLPFDVVTGGLDQILFRPTTEITDDDKVKVIGKLRELGTQEANKFLKDVQVRWPKGGSARVRQSIDQAVLATAGGAQ